MKDTQRHRRRLSSLLGDSRWTLSRCLEPKPQAATASVLKVTDLWFLPGPANHFPNLHGAVAGTKSASRGTICTYIVCITFLYKYVSCRSFFVDSNIITDIFVSVSEHRFMFSIPFRYYWGHPETDPGRLQPAARAAGEAGVRRP